MADRDTLLGIAAGAAVIGMGTAVLVGTGSESHAPAERFVAESLDTAGLYEPVTDAECDDADAFLQAESPELSPFIDEWIERCRRAARGELGAGSIRPWLDNVNRLKKSREGESS